MAQNGPHRQNAACLAKGAGRLPSEMPAGHRPLPQRPIVPGRNFCAQPLPLSLTITGACGGLPRSVSKAAACGVPRSFGAAALEKSCVKKPGRPDGLPGFLRACIRRQSRQANPAASCGGAPKRGLCLKTAPPLPSLKKAALCGDTLILPCAPGRIVRAPGSAGGLRKPRRGILPASLSGGTECSAFCIACPPPANGVLPAVCCIF